MVRIYEEARFIESMIEELQMMYLPYMLEHTECDSNKITIITEYMRFVIKQLNDDIHAKRGKAKLSYQDQRDDTDYKELLTRYMKHVEDCTNYRRLLTVSKFLSTEDYTTLEKLK